MKNLPLQWRYNERDGVLNHRRQDCLSKFRAIWPLWEFTGDRWIPLTNGQQRGKSFHLMTSSWRCRLAPRAIFFDVLLCSNINIDSLPLQTASQHRFWDVANVILSFAITRFVIDNVPSICCTKHNPSIFTIKHSRFSISISRSRLNFISLEKLMIVMTSKWIYVTYFRSPSIWAQIWIPGWKKGVAVVQYRPTGCVVLLLALSRLQRLVPSTLIYSAVPGPASEDTDSCGVHPLLSSKSSETRISIGLVGTRWGYWMVVEGLLW